MSPKPDTGTAVENEDPAQDVKEEQDAEKPPKTEEKAPERRKTEDRDDGPPPNSPRWNEVYGKWKSTERKLEEREKDFDAMREHNRQLEARLNKVEETKADRPPEPEPDPAIDPDAYKKWHEMKRLKDREEWDRARMIDRHETQVEMQKEIHGEAEYLAKIKIAEAEMAKDPQLKQKIWGAPNPAKAAYLHGKMRADEMAKKEQEEESREKTKRQIETEPVSENGGEPEDRSEERLSDEEVRVCRNLWPDLKLEESKKKYLKQKKAMGR